MGNWQEFEFYYRDQLDLVINFSHTHPVNVEYSNPVLMGGGHNEISEVKKWVFINCVDPNTSLIHFFRVSPRLGGDDVSRYLEKIQLYRQMSYECQQKFPQSTLCLDFEDLFSPTLPYSFYLQLAEFLELDDNYEYAKIVHAKWYERSQYMMIKFEEELNYLTSLIKTPKYRKLYGI